MDKTRAFFLKEAMNLNPQKIAIIGNIATGKTTLARRLSKELKIPVIHVDTIQFTQDLKIQKLDITREILLKHEAEAQWIIDGHGPLDLLEARLKKSDQIIFLDHSPWFCWIMLTFRQFKNIFWPRAEMINKQSELTWGHTKKLYRTVWAIHKKMRPELKQILDRQEFKDKVKII